MDAENNHNNHVQNHQDQEDELLLPPLLRDLLGLEELRAAIEELQREDMAAALEAQAQPPDGVSLASTTNGHPPPPPPPPPPPQLHPSEGENSGFLPNAVDNGHHSDRAASITNGQLFPSPPSSQPPPPQDHDSDSDIDNVPLSP